MAIPTFNGVDLVTDGAREVRQGPQLRMRAEPMPGVNGLYVQPLGSLGSEIRVRGILRASGPSLGEAHQALSAAIAARQAQADGATVATYVGADGATRTNCVLKTYHASGEVQLSPEQSTCRAFSPVEATVLHLTP